MDIELEDCKEKSGRKSMKFVNYEIKTFQTTCSKLISCLISNEIQE